MDITLIAEKREHWTWREELARACAREEREIGRLAETPIILALASALGKSPREAATIARKRALGAR